MPSNAYTTVANSQYSTKQGTTALHLKQLLRFPAAGPLTRLAMHFLCPLPEIKSCNQHIIFLTDRFTKLARAIAVTTVTSTSLTTVLAYNWVTSYCVSAYLLTDYRLQFISKFSAAITTHLVIKPLTTTAYHTQTKLQMKIYNKTIMVPFYHYVSKY